MDIRTLRYFLATARAENITKAAELLHISQPSLSVQLAELERELGKSLLIRGKRKITLTPNGILLRKRAGEIIALMEKTQREIIAEDVNKITGDISLGSGETEAMNFAVQAAAQIYAEYPEIHYHLFSGDADAIMERLDNGLLDFGILMEPIDIKKYERMQLPIMDTWGILMKTDSLLAHKEYLKFSDIKNLPLITPERIGLKQELSSWLHDDFQSLNIVASYNLIHNASLLVKAGFGYALALENLVYTGKDSGLLFIPFRPAIESKMCIVWKKYQVFSKASEHFLNILKMKLL